MPDITVTRQTSLQDRDLRERINTAIQALRQRSPYSQYSSQFTSSWDNDNRMSFGVPGLISGTIDVRDGSPSVVTASATLSGAARLMRSSVQGDVETEMIRYLPSPGAGPEIPTTASGASTASAPAPASQETQQDGGFDWGMFGQVFSNLLQGGASALTAYNDATAVTTADQAVNIAFDEAAAQGVEGKQLPAPSVGVQEGPGFTLGPGKVVQPGEPDIGPPAESNGVQQQLVTTSTTAQNGMPTWGWVLLGVGGVSVVGAIVYMLTREDKDKGGK